MSNATIIKVRGYHLDVYQHVNNARYLEFLEEARWQWLEDHGAFEWMMKEAIAFMVVNLNINYRRGAVLNDELIVESKLHQLNGRSGVLNQTITRTSDNEIIIDAALTFVCTDLKTQKALPLEGALRDRLLELSGDK
ncbi:MULTISPECIES: acyl-CoA thioesterase [Hafnia]|jgi:thioesterase-3|uniref:YbgC/FadM family acyl-CoA thioesterase n=2 Tax=Hafnia TaxID=568 RepID=A0A4Q9EYV7_9GAMM|nr:MULTISPECIES: YbgC/FadM family acyl-CoA thioesterase [Hafnia]AJR00241.1 4-hydroxybenzoyl-CoA thioesterase family active site [Enterobacteriaceae bacterium bta3-1]EHM43745.1 acyl-CoA thioester hydrolase, YbgC/YbaW family [Hafnia alvei ATCC 51873]OFS12595.1 thioesterase [Hafnia sp. HMSC23F03]QQE44002.1 YbgC/FadM family acyl-CoA thioesterase [Hafnia alvei]TBM32526.1 YbgC/FadM family acyl-CoA thioesterase [Hafnia paralvei]